MNTQAQCASLHTWSNQRDCREVLHWDGRLDNRADLLLRLRDWLAGETSNAALALAAYERWGTSGLVHLIGDWSAVIRDHSSRTIVLASDFAGVRPLYYHADRGRVLWSSRLQTLVDATGIAELDRTYMRGFLCFGGCRNRTPYRGIYSVPSGHAVCVSPLETAIRQFWELPAGDTIRYRDERRYEEQFRELFREAVAVRLQTSDPVLAELSGGLDSTSVVCMAKDLVRSGAVTTSRLTGLSYLWKDSLDEAFIRDVESHCGIEGESIFTRDAPLIAETQAGDVMPQPFQPLRTAVAAIAKRLGAGTILTGQNGDLVNGNWFDDSLQVAASLRRFQVGRAWNASLEWSKILRLPVYRILWRAFQAALPAALAPAAIYIGFDGSCAPKSTETSLVSIPNDSIFSNVWMQAPPERRKHFRYLSMMLELRTLQPPEPLQHLDYTHPFAHRPLVEFLMTIPAEVLCRPGEPRRLMRAALPDLWPAKVRNRRSKSAFNVPWQEALRPITQTLLRARRLHVVEMGFVDHTSVLSRLERLAAGLDCNGTQLRLIILAELWLRNRSDRIRPAQDLPAA